MVCAVVALAVVLGEESAAMMTKIWSTRGLKGWTLVNVRARLTEHMLFQAPITDAYPFHLLMRSTASIGTAASPTAPMTSTTDTVIAKCPKCGSDRRGTPSCCAQGGSWIGKCGDDDESMEHTWLEGQLACRCKRLVIFS